MIGIEIKIQMNDCRRKSKWSDYLMVVINNVKI